MEFDVVFLPGWKKAYFPSKRKLEEKGDFALEEEEDLTYVELQKKRLICHLWNAYHGDWIYALPSRFVNEIPDESVEKNEIGLSEKMTLNSTKIIQLNWGGV